MLNPGKVRFKKNFYAESQELKSKKICDFRLTSSYYFFHMLKSADHNNSSFGKPGARRRSPSNMSGFMYSSKYVLQSLLSQSSVI